MDNQWSCPRNPRSTAYFLNPIRTLKRSGEPSCQQFHNHGLTIREKSDQSRLSQIGREGYWDAKSGLARVPLDVLGRRVN